MREVAKEKQHASYADWIFPYRYFPGSHSALAQWVGAAMQGGLSGAGLAMFDKGTCTTVFVTVLGLICAMTPLGKLPAVEELSNVYLYAVVSLLASVAHLPIWYPLRCGWYLVSLY